MCDDCAGQCVDNVCVCSPDYTDSGEGIFTTGCRLNEKALDVVWLITLCLSFSLAGLIVVRCAVWLKTTWGNGYRLDLGKLVTNNVFQITCCVWGAALATGVYAAIRVFAGNLFLNDYPATVVVLLARCFVLRYGQILADMFRTTVIGVLAASGIKNTSLEQRSKWVVMFEKVFGYVLYIPPLAAPAIPHEHRTVFVQYYLVSFIVITSFYGGVLIITGKRTLKLLATVGVEAAEKPRKKVHFLMTNAYFAITNLVVVNLVFACTKYIIYFPYLLLFQTLVILICVLGPSAFFTLDPTKVCKVLPRRSIKTQKLPPDSSKSSHSKRPEDDKTHVVAIPSHPTSPDCALPQENGPTNHLAPVQLERNSNSGPLPESSELHTPNLKLHEGETRSSALCESPSDLEVVGV